MATPLSPSKTLTENQIKKLKRQFSDALRKVNPFSGEAQDLIENSWDELKDEVMQGCVDAINRVMERKSKPIIRKVRVNRKRTAQETLDATRRVQYVNAEVLATMPVGSGPEEVELHYFNLGRFATDKERDCEYKRRGLEPDPQAQADDNAADPSFADKYPNASGWGNHCYIAFDCWIGVSRNVNCNRDDGGWNGEWWFAGVRKVSPPKAQ